MELHLTICFCSIATEVVEEQLRLLQELAPEWIHEKSSLSGDLLLWYFSPVFVFVSLHHNLHSLHTIIMIMIMCLIFSLVLQCEQDLKPRSHADSTVRGDIKEAIKTRSCFVPSNILQINPFVFMVLPLKKCQILLIFEPSQKTSIPLFLVCNLS